ncbi:CPBP family intramembrane glutamic endopeptidase [Halalkalicoccus salilacus]
MVPLSILLVGPGEELLFRGIIQQLLRIRFGVPVGITIASVIFAVAHVGSLTGEGLVATLATYVVLSLILGVSYEYSENLVVPATIHGLFNAIQFLALYWSITSGNVPIVLVF